MSNHPHIKSHLVRALVIMGLILPTIVPESKFVSAQGEMARFSQAHFIYPSEFGVTNPQGMAFLPDENSFIVWSAGQGATAITLYEEGRGKIALPQQPVDPLSAAFDNKSKSLFLLGAGNTELSKLSSKQAGLPDQANTSVAGFDIRSFDLQDAQGLTFDPATGRLFILDARRPQVLVVSPHPTQGFDGASAAAAKRIGRVDIRSISRAVLRGIAFNPNNGHLYVGSPDERKVYELTETGERVSTYDVSDLHLENPATMLFAPSRDATDDPDIMDLYILDSGQNSKQDSALITDQRNNSQKGQIVELSLQAPAVLPPGTTLLPASLVQIIDTSNASWSPSSPDPAGIDYFPLTGRLLISDSEVDEMPPYWAGANVFLSTTSGNLTGTCSTTAFTGEPTGVAVNPNNHHIFIAADFQDKLFEISLGPDGQYCTADDVITTTSLGPAYGVTDAEDVAYGNNTVFIAGGADAEVFRIPLGPNGVMGGGDDGPMTHWDTAALGFADTEGIGFNHAAGTLFIVSTKRTDKYLGETTISGTLLRAYDLAFMGNVGNIRSDVAYAPGSQNPSVKTIYIASRGVDNDTDRNENDGRIWEINISGPGLAPTVTSVLRADASPTAAATVNYTVSFSESVIGVDASDFSLTKTGVISGESVGTVTGSGALYNVAVNTGTGNGTLRLNVLDNNSIMDVDSNPLNGAFNSGEVYTIDKGANVDVTIGGNLVGNYDILPEQSIPDTYGINGGPVLVSSTDGTTPIFTSQRAIFGSSFNSIVGYPADQLTTDYWFTSYDDLGMITYLVIGNPHPSLTAQVDVYIGGNKMNATPYSIAPGQRIFPRYGINAGPVHVVSTNGVNIFTSERTKYLNSFNEVLGIPEAQLTTDYWFTSYDDVGMITYLVIGNPHATLTAEVDVYIGGVKKNAVPYSIAPGQRIFPRYAINGGPVQVVSTNGVNIFTSERSKFGQSFNEVLGYPADQLTTDYWFTSYDDASMITYLVIGNPHATLTAEVDVYIAGTLENTYSIAPGQRVFPRYGVNSGPVHVISTNGVDIFTSERTQYLSSFNEILGLANNQLTTDYWFTSYDDVGMDTELVISAP